MLRINLGPDTDADAHVAAAARVAIVVVQLVKPFL